MNENDEFQFLLLQSISRSKIRLNQKRGFLIDYVIGIDQSIRSKEFYDSVKESLNQVDLDHILEAQVQEQDLDLITKLSQERVPGDPENIQSEHHHHQSRGNEYWKAVNHLVTGSKQTTRDGVVSLVKTQMNEMFQKKSLEEMKGLKLQIEEKLRKGGSNVDLDYWDSCLKSLLYAIARATLQKAIDSLSHIDDIGLSADSSASSLIQSTRQAYTKDMAPTYSNAIMDADKFRKVYSPEEDLKFRAEERKRIWEKVSSR